MKRFINTYFALTALLALSCQKHLSDANTSTQEIVIAVNDNELVTEVQTKSITPVSSLPASLYWGATTGSGSESTKWASASATISAKKISTGKYQTATPTTYNYYVSNVSMSVGANTTVSATGGTSGTDVICGRATTESVSPAVKMNHIFARTGTLKISTPGTWPRVATLTGLSCTIKAKGSNTGNAGTYNLRTGVWSSTSGLTSDTAINSSSDMYVIPGDYTFAVTGTYTRGDYVVTKTLTGTVTLTAGKINNITFTWPESGTEILASVTLTAWDNQSVETTIGYNCPAVDLGGTSTVLYASWNVGATSETEYGDYFAWGETAKRYTNSAASLQNNNDVTLTGATFEWSNAPYNPGISWDVYSKYVQSDFPSQWYNYPATMPDNKLTLDFSDDAAHVQWGGDWRMPTGDELRWLTSNCTWSWRANYNSSGINGYLITGPNSATIFLPAAGVCTDNSRGNVGLEEMSTLYWASSLDDYEPLYGQSTMQYQYMDVMYYDVTSSNRYVGQPIRAVKPKS